MQQNIFDAEGILIAPVASRQLAEVLRELETLPQMLGGDEILGDFD